MAERKVVIASLWARRDCYPLRSQETRASLEGTFWISLRICGPSGPSCLRKALTSAKVRCPRIGESGGKRANSLRSLVLVGFCRWAVFCRLAVFRVRGGTVEVAVEATKV